MKVTKKAKTPSKGQQRMISLYLDENLYQALRHYAFDKNVKYATFIRELLKKELLKTNYIGSKSYE